MQPFDRVTGIAAPMPRPNIDTDVIMPKQFLKRIDREGLAQGVFHDLRRKDGEEDPAFILNRPDYRNARFLVTGANFGCGSSREHAVWGLLQTGIRAIVAPSFASIFFGNCEKNGLLAITLPAEVVGVILDVVGNPQMMEMTVDLERQRIDLADGRSIAFEIDPGRRETLLSGRDHIAATLEYAEAIRAFEAAHLQQG